MEAAFLLLCNELRKNSILLRFALAMDKAVVSASGYCKKRTHHGYWVFLPVAVYNAVFYFWLHLLPVDRRKSRNNLFSICKRWISYACSATMFFGAASFLGLPFGLG